MKRKKKRRISARKKRTTHIVRKRLKTRKPVRRKVVRKKVKRVRRVKRKAVSRKTSKPSNKKVVGKRKKSKSNNGKFRDTNGRFISRKKWERKNLPKRAKKKPVEKKRREWKEGDRFKTPKAKYEYRQFLLENYDAETIRDVIETVIKEPRPHPILFFIHMDYDDKDGDSGDVGTSFFKFRPEESQVASEQCQELASAYEIDTIDSIELMATYSIV